MSIKHLNWAFEQDLPAGPKLTLIALCDALNQDGEWHIKHETLAKKTSQHRSTIIRHIADLVERGLVESIPTRHVDGKQGYNLYRVSLCDSVTPKPESHPVAPESHPATTRVAPCDSNNHPYSPKDHPEDLSPVPDDPSLLKNDFEKCIWNWNVTAEDLGLSKVTVINTERKKALDEIVGKVGKDGWDLALDALEKSEFCQGKNDRGWKATFDWVCRPDKYQKLIGGDYE